MPSFEARLITERILVPNTPSFTARVEQRVELRHRLHQLDAVLFGFEPLVDFEERARRPGPPTG